MVQENVVDAEQAIRFVLKENFGLIGQGTFTYQPFVSELKGASQPDYVYIEEGIVVYIELKNRVVPKDIALASAAKKIISNEYSGEKKTLYLIFSKQISDEAKKIATILDIPILRLDWNISLPKNGIFGQSTTLKLSSEKAWRVVSSLLTLQPASIREVSLYTKISYGWTHRVISRLIDMNVASRTPQGITIHNIDLLLRGIAWERDLRKLELVEFLVTGSELISTAHTIQESISDLGVDSAFTAITAAGILTHSAQRFDQLHLYVNFKSLIVPRNVFIDREKENYSGENKIKWNIGILRNMLEDRNGSIKLFIYMPDRDVFKNKIIWQDLKLADPSVILLDLTSFGYGAWELTKEMVSYYEKTTH